MKAVLLSDGTYDGIPEEALGQPVEVFYEYPSNGDVEIRGSELIRIGADPDLFIGEDVYPFYADEVSLLD